MQGDREECLIRNMNELIAKPIRMDAPVKAPNNMTARKET